MTTTHDTSETKTISVTGILNDKTVQKEFPEIVFISHIIGEIGQLLKCISKDGTLHLSKIHFIINGNDSIDPSDLMISANKFHKNNEIIINFIVKN